MHLIIHTDGGSLKNPGQAAYAFTVHSGGKLIYKQNERIGIASNNVAEYMALIRALEYVKKLLSLGHSERPVRIATQSVAGGSEESSLDPSVVSLIQDDIGSITVISDSELMVRQVTGIYKVKHPDIRPLHSQVKVLEMEIGHAISYTHVLRDKNEEADALVKEALAA